MTTKIKLSFTELRFGKIKSRHIKVSWQILELPGNHQHPLSINNFHNLVLGRNDIHQFSGKNILENEDYEDIESITGQKIDAKKEPNFHNERIKGYKQEIDKLNKLLWTERANVERMREIVARLTDSKSIDKPEKVKSNIVFTTSNFPVVELK